VGVFSDHPVECQRIGEPVRVRHSTTSAADSAAVSTAAKVLAGPASYPVAPAPRKPADHGVQVVAVHGPVPKRAESKGAEAAEPAPAAPQPAQAPQQQGVSLATTLGAAFVLVAGSFAAGMYFAQRVKRK
jgi:hypothetical protein